MGMTDQPPIDQLLQRVRAGEPQSLDALLVLVYAELRALAASYLRHDRTHTLQPTALVHEAFLKLASGGTQCVGEEHFKAVAAKAMRQVLVDHARKENAIKRGGGTARRDLSIHLLADEGAGAESSREIQVQELDELLIILARSSARAARVAEMYLFGGMDTAQTALVLGVSEASVKRDWQVARAWLAGKIQERGGG
jgi:RNA polymerase sigma factor (TIGR02999 family)